MRATLEFVAILLFSCSLAYTAHAVTYTFIQGPAVNVTGTAGSSWTNATLWTGSLIPTNDSANDDVFINATLLRNRKLSLLDTNLKIRSLTLLCPDAPNGEFQPFELIFRRNNILAVNITTSGWCSITWESQAGKVFNVTDSWVSGSMLGFFSGPGMFTVGRYFNSTRFGSGNTFSQLTVVIPYPQNRHLRSRVGTNANGIPISNNAQVDWHNVELYQGSSGYVELKAGRLSLANVSITSPGLSLSSGEVGNCTLILSNFTSVGHVLQKVSDVVSTVSTVIFNDDVQISGTNRNFYVNRGPSRIYVNGRVKIASMTFGFMESPQKNSTLNTQVHIAPGGYFEAQTVLSSGSGISKQFGYNTQFFINGTLKLGSGSAVAAASQMYANTTEPWGTISFGCPDRNGEIITDPIVFGPNTIVGGCNFRTVAGAAQQNFSVVTFGSGSTLALDGSGLITATRFYTNATLEAAASIYATVVPLVSNSTIRPSISCLPPCKIFHVSSSAITVEPLSAIQYEESVPIISATAGASDVMLTAGTIQPNELIPVQNGSHLALFRPVPAPVNPPLADPPVDPPMSPPTFLTTPSGTPGASSSPNAAATKPVSHASCSVAVSLTLILGALFCLFL